MFRNYLKLAIKVLGRRKFFTFISLFGISFTLMVLMVIMAFLDTELGANPPMTEADRMVLIDRLEMRTNYYDTIWTIDSSLVGGVMVYDTTDYETQDAGRSQSSGSVGLRAFREFLHDVQPQEMYAAMFNRPFDVFQEGRKYQMEGIYTDAEYWQILDFTFKEGRPFNRAEVDGAQSVMVITDRMAREFFGTDENIVGREIPLSGRQFEVVGLVARTRSSSQFTRADVYIPITT
ncbi:MAG: ABC transporter permease, partial [Bacteroidota bacterium]